jgi:hypothetical protein
MHVVYSVLIIVCGDSETSRYPNDAVIGIGGSRPDNKEDVGIRHKVNWVGLGAQTTGSPRNGNKYPTFFVVFDHFKLSEENGDDLSPENYRNLYDYMYEGKRRYKIIDMSDCSYDNALIQEIKMILDSVKDTTVSGGSKEENNDRGEVGCCKISTCRSQ